MTATPSEEGRNPPALPEEGAKGALSDARKPWEWKSRYPADARKEINEEGALLAIALAIFLALSGGFLSLANYSFVTEFSSFSAVRASADCRDCVAPPSARIDMRLLAVFFCGGVGGTTFSIKWLIHSVAKGTWHLDRRYWRYFVPFVGGVYACVVLTLFDAGLLGAQPTETVRPIAITAALAFLVGYFSDGVSGLLSNVANAVFGTVEKK